MEFTDTENALSLMIFIDFKKAFDSVDEISYWAASRPFNFGPDFIR